MARLEGMVFKAINNWLDRVETRLSKFFYKIDREIRAPIRIFPMRKLKALSLAMRQVPLPVEGTAINMEAWHNAVNYQYKIIRLTSKPTNRFTGKRPYTVQQAKALLALGKVKSKENVMIDPEILHKMFTGQRIDEDIGLIFKICPDLTTSKDEAPYRTLDEKYSIGLLTSYAMEEKRLSPEEAYKFYSDNPFLLECVKELRFSRYDPREINRR